MHVTRAQFHHNHLLKALNLLYTSRGLCSNHSDQLLHAMVLAQEQEKSRNPQRLEKKHQLASAGMTGN